MAAFDGLGKALRWLRARRDLRQYQVAEAAGVTKAMLSAYETGKQKPSLETLEKILDGLGVNLGDLYHALLIVNERTDLLRFRDHEGAAMATAPLQGAGSGDIDLNRILGTSGPLPVEEEHALRQMLQGFHRLMRFMHQSIRRGEAKSSATSPPARSGDGSRAEATSDE